MAFDQATRNRLQRFVSEARVLLTKEFTRQLQNDYGIDPSTGEVASLEALSHLDNVRRETGRILRVTLEHYRANSPGSSITDLLERIVREQAFTVLNRLAALRMAEAREFLTESIANGYDSRGFQLYIRLAGTGLGETGEAYRSYLFSLFDEFALDLRVLFDRFSPMGRLFPSETELLKLLKLMNGPEIADLWVEDETIGWIYQYFNSKDERKKMRDESAAPRNSRELAVRNQFFTPRYVVEFLTDNTLGRIWYEMTQGETALKDHCRYLVRRPAEIFLQEGATAPESAETEASLSQEELLKQPVYIPHRSLKDPREIRMLDPACGSMHFGLYAFDLYECIYEEAWDLEEQGIPFQQCAGREPLTATYDGKEAFLRDVPRLIIEHNIHGVDIDPRAVQIAGLSLWLRAQKSWQAQELKLSQRPQIQKSNVVCAEPMPGEERLLNEFLEQHLANTPEQQLVGQLVRRVFEAMKLAGEAGSLLQIEQEISKDIEEAKSQWSNRPKTEQLVLLAVETNEPQQQELLLKVDDITDERFWERVEGEIYKALNRYAEQAENGNSFQRRLFANDAVRGFAFIDLWRNSYDVVLMNPPFGKCSEDGSSYFETTYSSFKSDIGIAFVSQFIRHCVPNGCLGAITSRGFLASDSFEDWRRESLLLNRPINCLLDLGYGVLDDAMVEAAAYVIDASPSLNAPKPFIRVLESRLKEEAVRQFFTTNSTPADLLFFQHHLTEFRAIPLSVICYWFPTSILRRLKEFPQLSESGGAARHGLVTTDDFRFFRLTWEIEPKYINGNSKQCWKLLAKGGEYQPFWDDLHICVDWSKNGDLLKVFLAEKRLKTQGSADWSPWLNHSEFYLMEGLTYPERTTSDFCPRILPKEVIFSSTGQAIQFNDDRSLTLAYLCGSFTRFFKLLVESFVGSGDNAFPGSAAKHYRSGLLNQLPPPLRTNDKLIWEIAHRGIEFSQFLFASDETTRNFLPQQRQGSLNKIAMGFQEEHLKMALEVIRDNLFVEKLVSQNFQLSQDEVLVLDEIIGPHPQNYPKSEKPSQNEVSQLWMSQPGEIIKIAIKRHGPRRQLTKKTFIANRKLELISHTLKLSSETVVDVINKLNILAPELLIEAGSAELSFALGCSFGRWDIRYVIGEKTSPELCEPFDALPVCPPGMLQNSKGLPVEPSDINSSYPVRISWSGILVDDEGHPDDVVNRIRSVLKVIWGDKDSDVEQEACEILKVNSLRNYFRKPAAFFNDHLSRYSKSRRQAPIYLPLSTASGSYTLWLYYHRLTDQTLYTCINDYVEPKLSHVSETVKVLRGKTSRTRDEENNLEDLQTLEDELTKFRDELLRVAKLPWKPNLNDGVQITVAPLHSLFRLSKWQKKLKETWDKLEKGDYDWAHLAYSIWTARVREKCRTDKSLAIAHGLEDFYEPPPESPKRTKRKKKE